MCCSVYIYIDSEDLDALFGIAESILALHSTVPGHILAMVKRLLVDHRFLHGSFIVRYVNIG